MSGRWDLLLGQVPLSSHVHRTQDYAGLTANRYIALLTLLKLFATLKSSELRSSFDWILLDSPQMEMLTMLVPNQHTMHINTLQCEYEVCQVM